MEEIDIWPVKILIDAHGDQADLQAAMRADHALEDDNLDGVMVWKKILRAIEELLRTIPKDSKGVN